MIAKLDRLARNARFLLHVVEGTGEAGVVFCDLPSVPPGPVGKFLLTQMTAVAELETGLISQRTRVALAVARTRGTRLGNPRLRAGAPEQALAAAAAKSRQARARAADVLSYLDAARRAGARTLHRVPAPDCRVRVAIVRRPARRVAPWPGREPGRQGRLTLALVVDASVGLKWVLQEPDSHLADALARSGANLLVPDFWLNEATNVVWLQASRTSSWLMARSRP